MPFPATKADMLEDGYTFAAMKTCPCGEPMELWNTPRGATMPMNPMAEMDSPAVSHWATCVKAEQFRRKKPDAKP
jgi:hypothetical protein